MDIEKAMMQPPSSEQESYSDGMGGHSEMMCRVLMGLGRLEAKIDMMMSEDKAEDKKESENEGPVLATNPAIYSNQLEFDLPPLF